MTTTTATTLSLRMFFSSSFNFCVGWVFTLHIFVSAFVIWLIYFFEVEVFVASPSPPSLAPVLSFLLSKCKQNSCVHISVPWNYSRIARSIYNVGDAVDRTPINLGLCVCARAPVSVSVCVCVSYRTASSSIYQPLFFLGMFYLIYRHEQAFHLVLIAFSNEKQKTKKVQNKQGTLGISVCVCVCVAHWCWTESFEIKIRRARKHTYRYTYTQTLYWVYNVYARLCSIVCINLY